MAKRKVESVMRMCRLTERFNLSPEISSRWQWGDLLNKHGLAGAGVEVGVHRGDFADAILRHWKGKILFGVDPWAAMPDYRDVIAESNQFEENHQHCIKRLAPYVKRWREMRMTSEKAARHFADDSLDFAYIDANHDRKFVEQDIRLWMPKVRPGGILGGHDINDVWESQVRPPVEDLADRLNVDVFLIPGEQGKDAGSWYVIKPESKGR